MKGTKSARTWRSSFWNAIWDRADDTSTFAVSRHILLRVHAPWGPPIKVCYEGKGSLPLFPQITSHGPFQSIINCELRSNLHGKGKAVPESGWNGHPMLLNRGCERAILAHTVTLSSLLISACFCLGSLDSVLRQPLMPFLTPTLTQNTPPIL